MVLMMLVLLLLPGFYCWTSIAAAAAAVAAPAGCYAVILQYVGLLVAYTCVCTQTMLMTHDAAGAD